MVSGLRTTAVWPFETTEVVAEEAADEKEELAVLTPTEDPITETVLSPTFATKTSPLDEYYATATG